jgi:DNA-binding response OmpR family regulator
MVRAVVVNSDPRLAERHAEALRTSGYAVEYCSGPEHAECPVLIGLPCPLADRADVLIYDTTVMGDSGAVRELVEDVRETYPDLPIVLTSADESLDWIETEGPHRVRPLRGEPTSGELLAAVDDALSDQGMAV